jgi:vancomycin permeability regulator SanA
VGVVLGNEVKLNGQPSDRLRARVEKAAELYKAGYFPWVIVSGGVGVEGFDEAAVMKEVLVQHHVPANVILTDNAGRNTYFTAQNAARTLRKNRWKSAFIVTQFYHVPRTRLAFQRFGISPVYYAHPDYFEVEDVYSLAREVLAICVYAFRRYPDMNAPLSN